MILTDERIKEIVQDAGLKCVAELDRWQSKQPATPLIVIIESAIRQALKEALEWRDMESAPRDGTEILVNFRGIGAKSVAWLDPHGDSYEIWCVDDNKHGPYPLRGYSEGDELGWLPLPPFGPTVDKEQS